MKWTGTRPSTPIITIEQMQSQLRVDADLEYDYITDIVDACTEYAEQALDSSLLTRSITAIYYRPAGYDWTSYGLYLNDQRLPLPRGPVQSIVSVSDGINTSINYKLEAAGNLDLLRVLTTWTPPLTVVYTAGYGSNVSDVPADIRMAIRTHAATLFEQRASTDEKQILPVPHSLEAFYQLRRRTCPVG